MSYDLAVWDGTPPADDRSARDEYLSRVERHPDGTPPTPKIAALVAALTERFPDLTDLDDDEIDSIDTPWASGPLLSEASGDFFYFPMTFSGAEAHLTEVVALVVAHGLVCFDPQAEQVYRGAASSAAPTRSAANKQPSLVARYPILRLPITFAVVAVLLVLLDKCSG